MATNNPFRNIKRQINNSQVKKPFVLKLFYFESNIDTSRDMRICCVDKITAIEFMEFLHEKKWKDIQPEFGNPFELLKVTRVRGHLKRLE